jgi:O-antigen/teichoic acid export membrane protein
VLFLHKTLGLETLQHLIPVSDKVEYIFIANLVASAFILIMVTPYMFKVKWVFDASIFKKLLNYGLPIMGAGLAFVINENLDKWLLPKSQGQYINGAYSACYKLAVFMTLFIQAFRMGAEPFFFNYAKEKNAKTTYAIILKYFTIVGVLGLMIITIYIDWLRPLFIKNESYLLAIDIVPIVLLANLCLGIYHNLSVWYKLTDKTQFGMYISIIGAILTIAINIFGIPRYGFMASAFATLIAYGGMMCISYALGKKHYPVPYELPKIIAYLLIGVCFSFITYYVFNRNILIGTLFLCVFIGIVYKLEYNNLKQILKR